MEPDYVRLVWGPEGMQGVQASAGLGLGKVRTGSPLIPSGPRYPGWITASFSGTTVCSVGPPPVEKAHLVGAGCLLPGQSKQGCIHMHLTGRRGSGTRGLGCNARMRIACQSSGDYRTPFPTHETSVRHAGGKRQLPRVPVSVHPSPQTWVLGTARGWPPQGPLCTLDCLGDARQQGQHPSG